MAGRKTPDVRDPNFDAVVAENVEAEKAEKAARADKAERGEVAPVETGEEFRPARTEEVIAEGRVVDRTGDMGLAQYLERDDYDDEAQAESGYRSIIEQIMTSETMEEVLTPPEAISARDVVGVPLVISAFHVNQSEYDVGSPYYLSMQATRGDTGESVVINTGNQRIMAQLIRLDQLNSLPAECYIRQSKRPNRHGSFPLSLDSRPPEQWS